MDSKKLAFAEQFLSPRRKVVSGFRLGVGASFILLTVLLLSNSLKASIVNPLFQGFSNFSVSVNSSPVSWPFSFSSTIASSSVTNSSSATSTTATSESQRVEEGRVSNKTLEANVSGIETKESFLDANGSFSVEEEGVQGKTHEANGSVITKKREFLGSVGKGTVLENTHLENSPEKVEHGSFLGEEKGNAGNFSLSAKENVIAEIIIEGKNVENSADGNKKVIENNVARNLSYIRELDKSPGEERASKANNQGKSTEKNTITISFYDTQLTKTSHRSYENCDIFDGRWVRDDSKPYYPAGSCPYIDRDFDCHLNGRPDNGFVKWKWQPNGCDIPSLNATDFLERLRGKKLVFVGDSLNRNMWESLVCALRHSVRNKKRVYEISGRRDFKKKGFYAFRFEDYNCSVDFVGSPFLVRESSFNGRHGTLETLRLDLMDQTTSMYHDADVIIFNTGHWWTHEKTSRGEDYYQEGNYVHPRLKVLKAYEKALITWARWIDKNVDSSRTQIFFRGYSVTHFRGGQWNSGGQCHKEIKPIFNETYLAKYPSKMRALEHVFQEMKTPVIYLNISRLTDYRKDGHPSIYRMEYKTVEERIAAERYQDCSHWCLPGVPDTWNELLYASLLKSGRGSWRK